MLYRVIEPFEKGGKLYRPGVVTNFSKEDVDKLTALKLLEPVTSAAKEIEPEERKTAPPEPAPETKEVKPETQKTAPAKPAKSTKKTNFRKK